MAASSPYFSKPSRTSKTLALKSLGSMQSRCGKKCKIKIQIDNSVAYSQSNKIDFEKDSKDEEWQPNNWKEILMNIKEMRKERTAVVDSQGCERSADVFEKPEVQRYQTLISLMLSSQTKDQVTFSAMEKLKKHGLTIENITKTSITKIGDLIYPVGFWKRKAVYILEASKILNEKYNNDIPNSIDGLISLPGVGPKMAYICMNVAWGNVEGIGVDTHVHRIANRLRWVKKPTKTPEETRKALEEWLPRSEWSDINVLLVGFGQETCLPIRPKCADCLNKEICPATSVNQRMRIKTEECTK